MGDLNDNRFWRPDMSNLAAYLYLLEQTERGHYRNIVGAKHLIAPFYEFNMRQSPLNPDKDRLDWREETRRLL